jgi:hypothetical protein
VSVSPSPFERARPAEVVAGYMSAAAIFVSAMALAVRPLPLSVAALVLSLVATAIGGRWGRLHALAVAVSTAAFVVGMTIAVITSRPLY